MGKRKIILIVSGEIATGKSTLCEVLHDDHQLKPCKTKDYLQRAFRESNRHASEPSRDDLQKLGDKLDKKHNGKWVLDYFTELYGSSFDSNDYYFVDAVRTVDQVNQFRQAFNFSVVHIHLKASDTVKQKRYALREKLLGHSKSVAESSYKAAKSNTTERNVALLEKHADLIIETDKCNISDVSIRVKGFLKLLPKIENGLVDVIIGGQFGSEGKGHIAAHIAPEYDCLLRIGGPNAGHTVWSKFGNDVFHLLPSGTNRNPKAKILIGAGAVISIERILEEIKKYNIDELENSLVIDENATIISKKDIDLELKFQASIGSTAQGVGAATAKNIIERLKGNDGHKARNTPVFKPYIGSTTLELEKLFAANKRILLEGTQGSGLSIHHGMYPFVTSRDTTVSGCLSEAGISPKRIRKVIMVVRTYPIRVAGSSGPFLSEELDWKEISNRSGISYDELKSKEITTTTKRSRRVGEFSWTLFRKACELNSPSDIALTFTDYLSKDNRSASRYDQLTSETRQFIEEIECCSGAKVSLISTHFGEKSILDRRSW